LPHRYACCDAAVRKNQALPADGLRDMNLFERNFAGRFRPPDPSIVDRPHGDWKPLLVRNPILEKLSG